MVICSANKFTVNLQKLRQKFFRNRNGIFGKVEVKSSLTVLSSLVETCCTPALLYASECIVWNKTMIKVFESAYSHMFFKLFNTFDMSTVAQCQYYMGILPIELKIIARKLSFLHSINASENLLLRAMDPNNSELESVKRNYRISNASWNISLWNYFKDSLS